MKNKSWKYPFPTFSDKMFDGNKDGKLDAFETAFRDAYIEEMNRNAAKQNTRPKSSCYIPANTQNTGENKKSHKPQSLAEAIIPQLLLIIMSIICLIGGLLLAFVIEGGMLAMLLIIIGVISLALLLLRLAGVYK